jgi:hypothetical protein
LRRDGIIVPHAHPAPCHALWIEIARKAEMVARVKPPVIGVAKGFERSDIDHCHSLIGGVLPPE